MTCRHACAYSPRSRIMLTGVGVATWAVAGSVLLLRSQPLAENPAAAGDIDGGDFDLYLRGRQITKARNRGLFRFLLIDLIE